MGIDRHILGVGTCIVQAGASGWSRSLDDDSSARQLFERTYTATEVTKGPQVQQK